MKRTFLFFIAAAMLYGLSAINSSELQAATGIGHRFIISSFYANTDEELDGKPLYKKYGISAGFVADKTEHIELGVKLGLVGHSGDSHTLTGLYGKYNICGFVISDNVAIHPYAKYSRDKWHYSEERIWTDTFSLGADFSFGADRNVVIGIEAAWEAKEHADSDYRLFGFSAGWRFGHNTAGVSSQAVTSNIILQRYVNGMSAGAWQGMTGGTELNFGSRPAQSSISFGSYGNSWFGNY